jgi:hypothetical protein
MMPSRFEQLEKEICAAAAGRRYREVARLVPEYGEAVRAYVRSLPKGDPRAAVAVRQLDDLFSWTLAMLHAARFACAAELRRVATATRYARSYAGRERNFSLRLEA